MVPGMMLRPGLAASLRGIAPLRPASTILKYAAFAPRSSFVASGTPNLLQQAVRRPCFFQHMLVERPFTTSTILAARESPFSRPPHSPLSPVTKAQISEHYAASEGHERMREPREDELSIKKPSIFFAVLFFLASTILVFAGSAYYSVRTTEHTASNLRESRGIFEFISSFFTTDDSRWDRAGQVWGPGVDQRSLEIAHKHETAQRLGLRMDWLLGWCNQLQFPTGVTELLGRAYLIVAENYLELSPSKQVVVPIVAINTVVFTFWAVALARRRGAGRLATFMTRNFIHRPSSNRMRTMITSIFSHQTFLHFAFNNLALWSFGGAALITLMHNTNHPGRVPEASPTPHFLAFFLAAGLFAATVSHVVTAIRFRRLARTSIDLARRTAGKHAFLGSSGAVYAVLVTSAYAFPDAQLGIMFLPFVTFPIGAGVVGLLAADVAGIVLRWRMFDHWAHLGGAAFGWMYWHGLYGLWDGSMLGQIEINRLKALAEAEHQQAEAKV